MPVPIPETGPDRCGRRRRLPTPGQSISPSHYIGARRPGAESSGAGAIWATTYFEESCAAGAAGSEDRTMSMTYSPGRMNFGLLPEPEGRAASFVTAACINGTILAIILIIGMTARHVLVEHHYEMTELIVPQN